MAIEDFLEGVYEITNRPDLVTETTSALKRALKQAHFASFFWFDLEAEDIASTGDVSFSSPIPERFRSVKSIRNADESTGFEVREISPSAIFNGSVLVEKRYCYYLAGADIQFRISRGFTTLQHIFYQLPDWEDSYIALNYPEILHFIAAAKIFALLGDSPNAKFYEQLAGQTLHELVQQSQSI